MLRVKEHEIVFINPEYVENLTNDGIKSIIRNRCVKHDFVQMYLKDLEVFKDLKASDYGFLIAAFSNLRYYPGDMANSVMVDDYFVSVLTSICSKVTSRRSVEGIIARLVDRNLLFQTNRRGKYYLNPIYFYKGALVGGVSKVRALIDNLLSL